MLIYNFLAPFSEVSCTDYCQGEDAGPLVDPIRRFVCFYLTILYQIGAVSRSLFKWVYITEFKKSYYHHFPLFIFILGTVAEYNHMSNGEIHVRRE